MFNLSFDEQNLLHKRMGKIRMPPEFWKDLFDGERWAEGNLAKTFFSVFYPIKINDVFDQETWTTYKEYICVSQFFDILDIDENIVWSMNDVPEYEINLKSINCMMQVESVKKIIKE